MNQRAPAWSRRAPPPRRAAWWPRAGFDSLRPAFGGNAARASGLGSAAAKRKRGLTAAPALAPWEVKRGAEGQMIICPFCNTALDESAFDLALEAYSYACKSECDGFFKTHMTVRCPNGHVLMDGVVAIHNAEGWVGPPWRLDMPWWSVEDVFGIPHDSFVGNIYLPTEENPSEECVIASVAYTDNALRVVISKASEYYWEYTDEKYYPSIEVALWVPRAEGEGT